MSTTKAEPQAKAAHTPGPWKIQHALANNAIRASSKDGRPGLLIARCPQGEGFGDEPREMLANARLIAAAPETARQRDELLAALKEADRALSFHFAPDFGPRIGIRAAIAKAISNEQ